MGIPGHSHWNPEALQEFVYGYFSHNDQDAPSDARLRAYQEQVALLRSGADPKSVNLSAQLARSFRHYAMKLRGKRSPYFKALRDLVVAAIHGPVIHFGDTKYRVDDEQLRAAVDLCGGLPPRTPIANPDARSGPLTGLTAPLLAQWIHGALAPHLQGKLTASHLAYELALRFGMQDVGVVLDSRPMDTHASVGEIQEKVLRNVLEVLTKSGKDPSALTTMAEVESKMDLVRTLQHCNATELAAIKTLDLTLSDATPLVFGQTNQRRNRDKLKRLRGDLQHKLQALLDRPESAGLWEVM